MSRTFKISNTFKLLLTRSEKPRVHEPNSNGRFVRVNFGDFDAYLAERLRRAPGAHTSMSSLWDDYASWCATRRVQPESARRVVVMMKDRGFATMKTNILWFGGVTLRAIA